MSNCNTFSFSNEDIYITNNASLLSVSSSFPNLSSQVTVLDLETAEVHWTVRHPGQLGMWMEIMFGPEGNQQFNVLGSEGVR